MKHHKKSKHPAYWSHGKRATHVPHPILSFDTGMIIGIIGGVVFSILVLVITGLVAS